MKTSKGRPSGDSTFQQTSPVLGAEIVKNRSLSPRQEEALERQLKFFERKRAGCLFAAVAARSPQKYGWAHVFPSMDPSAIDVEVERAIESPSTSMVSMLFTEAQEPGDLTHLVDLLRRCKTIVLEQKEVLNGSVCLGFRALVDGLRSYVSGFGPFDFFPVTRQAPFTEIIMRTKPRPDYDFVFKEAPEGIVHLADLDMLGLPPDSLAKMWEGSFEKTEAILGAKPDLRSAARTTFAIPESVMRGSL